MINISDTLKDKKQPRKITVCIIKYKTVRSYIHQRDSWITMKLRHPTMFIVEVVMDILKKHAKKQTCYKLKFIKDIFCTYQQKGA